MNFGSLGEATVDLRVSLAKLPGDLAQAREQVTRLAAGIEAAATSGRGFEGLSQQARTLAPAVAEAARSAQNLQQVIATMAQAVPGSAGAVAQLVQQFGGLTQAAAPVAPALAAITAGTAGAAQGLRNTAAAAAAAGGAIGGGAGGIGGGGGLAGAAGSAGGALGVLNASLASFAGYLGAIAVRKVVGDLEALGSTALKDAEDWQLAAQKIQFSLGLTREAALRERATLAEASKGQPLAATFQLATFLGPSVLDLGRTRSELNGLIKELGQLAVVSGSSGEQARGAYVQLGQAFAIGKLQGQDLRALMQNMPALFEAIVQGSGRSREELVAMSHAMGGIPIGLVMDALQKQAPAVEAAFARMGTNVTQGLTDVRNAFAEAVGQSAAAVDAVNTLGGAFETLAEFMRSSDFQTALGPFATFVHDMGTGLQASITQVREWMEIIARAKAALTGGAPAAAADLTTGSGLEAHARAIEAGLANPPPTTTDVYSFGTSSVEKVPTDFTPRPLIDVPAKMREWWGSGQGEGTTPERLYGGTAPESRGPGLGLDDKVRLAAEIGAILQRAAAADPAGPGAAARPAKVEMVGSTEQGPIDRLQAFLANLVTMGAAGEAATSGAQLGAWLRGREGPQAGPGTLGAVGQAFPQPFDVGRPGATVADVAKPPVTLTDEQWKALAGLNFVASIEAFHGTGAAPFAKFDSSKIGTGEGNQTYGYGHYFAESETVAGGYRDKLGGLEQGVGGRAASEVLRPAEMPAIEDAKLAPYAEGGLQGSIDSLRRTLDAAQNRRGGFADLDPGRHAEVVGSLEGRLSGLEKISAAGGLTDPVPKGSLYNVKLDVEPHQLLDLDKPLREQSREVKDALERLVSDLRAVDPGSHAARDVASGRPSGQAFYSNLTSDLSQDLAGKDPARASESLRQAGIPGLRYLDGGSRADGQGTSNVVMFPGEESRIGVLGVNGQPVQRTPSPAAGTGLAGLAGALGLGAIGAATLGSGQAKAGEEEERAAAKAEEEAQAGLARLRDLLAQGDAMLARAAQVDAAREALVAGPQGPPTAPPNPSALYPGAHEGAEATRPMAVEAAVRTAADALASGLKSAGSEVADLWRKAVAPLTTPVAPAAAAGEGGQEAATAAVKDRAAADQETAAKARESGTALEQAGQGARDAGAAQDRMARSGEAAAGSLVSLAGAAHRLEAMLGGVAIPAAGDGAAKDQGGPAAKPQDQAGPTPALLAEAQRRVDEARQYVEAHMAGVGGQKAPTTELAASYQSLLLRPDTSVVEKAHQVAAADLEQKARMAAEARSENVLKGYEARGGTLTPVPGQEDIKRTQAAVAKRELDNKDRVAQREELARLKALEKDALASKVDSPEHLSAIQAARAETQGKVTALEARERAQQLATFTHGSEQEAASAAGRIYDKTATSDPRAALALLVKQDKAGIAAAGAAKDQEGVAAATKTLLADQAKLADYDQRRKDALAGQREALTGQASATERLTNDLEKIARGQRTQPGDSGPALAKASDVTLAKDAAYKRFAAGIEQEAGKDNQGKPERERAEAAIAALLAAETGHVGARAILEERIAQIKGRVGELDKADLEKLEAQNATIEASLAKSEAKLSRLKAGAGGDIAGAIDDAREAAQASVPSLTKEEAASVHGPEFEVRRDVQREQAGDFAGSTEFERQRQAAVKSVATAETSYIEVVKEADARRKAGLLTEQQYNRAIMGAITPLQSYREEMARIGAVEANVNLAVLKGTMSLDERRRKMLQLDADRGRAAAGERSATTRDLYDRGEQGSGVPVGSAIGGGAQGGALEFIGQYGNAAKDAGAITKTSLEGASEALTQFAMTGKADLAGLATSLEQMAIKMTIQLLLAKALAAAFGMPGGGTPATFGGGGGGLASQSGVAPAGFEGFMAGGWQSARGNAFEGGEMVPMATGGILSRETMIPMGHGGYADAGEQPGNTEAVIPLKRNARGDLGVQTDGGGGGGAPSITINNHGEPVGHSDTKWDPDTRTLEVTIRKMVDTNIAGGAHNRAMKSAFGLTPNVRR